MTDKPLWSDKHSHDDCDNIDHDVALYNLYEDIQCLKEDLKQAKLDVLLTETVAKIKDIQISDLGGYATGATCMLCNFLERSACYDSRRELELEIERLREEVEALTHEGRQGELEQANVGLATENEKLRQELKDDRVWRGDKPTLKDHEIATLVNELTAISKKYEGTEQLREHVSKCIVGAIK